MWASAVLDDIEIIKEDNEITEDIIKYKFSPNGDG